LERVLGGSYFSAVCAGAASFHRDSQSRRLDVLLTTPLTDRELVAAKLKASFRAAMPAWSLSLFHGVIAVLMGVHHVLALVIYCIVSWLMIRALAAFSLLVSLKAKTLTRSLVTVVSIFVAEIILAPIVAFALVGPMVSKSTHALSPLLGHNPLWLAAAPQMIATDPKIFSRDGGEFWFVYLCCYLTFSFLGGSLLERKFRAKRVSGDAFR
jgi:ABC-type transport system involved in multi-copper enzyme maturation permease subunit